MKVKLKKQLRKGLIDRLKAVERRLGYYAVSTSIKEEIKVIIESFEDLEG